MEPVDFIMFLWTLRDVKRLKKRGRGADRRIRTADLTLTKGVLYQLSHISKRGSDNDLLLHGETPHYHRRSCVSLLSSEWDQVVPQRYCRQAKTC